MSKSTLTRRAILTRAVSVSALAMPAVIAAAEPSFALAPPAVLALPSGPSKIEQRWIEREAARREYEINRRLCKRLKKVLERRMPDPHPSIVWGNPENDADGLKYWVPDRKSGYFKNYIFSGLIEEKLEKACELKFSRFKTEELDDGFVFTVTERKKDQEPFAFTEKELALQERLRSRLELSRRYERKMKRVSREIGLTAAERRRDRACNSHVHIDNKILKIPAASLRDLAAKVEIFDQYDQDIGGTEIVRDVRRLIVMPDAAFARGLASAHAA